MKGLRIILTSIALAMLFPLGTSAQKAANYDESLIKPYSLPDPLRMESGCKVRSVRQWEKKRRPELIRLFSEEVFGYVPGKPEGVHFRELTFGEAFDGKALRKEIAVYFDAEETDSLVLLLYLPKEAKGPVPAFLGINFFGNYTTTLDPEVTYPSEAERAADGNGYGEKARGFQARRWPYECILSRGYAVATFYCGDVDPDFDDGFTNGVHGTIYKAKMRTGSSWGTISTWAWGLMRAMDYLESDSSIGKVAVIGHSRLGKTALWAGALDERFSMVISNESGCTGAALSRRAIGETVGVIQSKFPHWFCRNYLKYSDKENTLPVDQHELLALVAPRPLYVASADGDKWSDPKGEYLSLLGAAPVYELYGLEALKDLDQPRVSFPVSAGRSAYHLRHGRHDIVLYDWIQYLNFADQFLK